MKLTEIICLIIFTVGLFFKSINWPGGTFLINISLILLAYYYLIFSFAVLNKINLLKIFKKIEYDELKISHILLGVFWGFTYPNLLFGALYKVMCWGEEWEVLLLTGIIVSVLLSFFTIYFLRNDKKFLKRVFFRLGVAYIIVLFLTFIKIC